MRGSGPLRKISAAELAEHASQFDCWTAYNGRVYNITQYLPYHPGGIPKLMQGAGKDSTALFNKYHPWVNCQSMLAKCLIGVLSADEATIEEGDEKEEEEVKKTESKDDKKNLEEAKIDLKSSDGSDGRVGESDGADNLKDNENTVAEVKTEVHKTVEELKKMALDALNKEYPDDVA